MTEMRDELDLATESLRSERKPDIVAQDFDGDVAIVLEIASEINRSHRSVTKLALDLVTVGDGCAQPLERCRHALVGSNVERIVQRYYMDVYELPPEGTRGTSQLSNRPQTPALAPTGIARSAVPPRIDALALHGDVNLLY